MIPKERTSLSPALAQLRVQLEKDYQDKLNYFGQLALNEEGRLRGQIAALTADRARLQDEILQRRSNMLTHPNVVYRAAYVDALCMVLALLPRQEPT